jgi:hypothetical protein
MTTKRKPFARISITLPPDVLAEADALAAELDRSRSWVFAEAVRRFARLPALVRELAPVDYAGGEVAAARTAHLRRDAERSPAERLRLAEELVELARLVHPRPRRAQILGFESVEDFAEWKKARRAGR